MISETKAQPIGADELLILLQTPTQHGVGVPALVHGKPGSGKTSFIQRLQLGDSNGSSTKTVTLVASLLEASDVSGLPYFADGKMRFAPPEWAYEFDDAEHGLLFIDELTCASHSVQVALLRVVLERAVGSKKLGPNVRIIAAANSVDDILGGHSLTGPLVNRFCHINWSMTPEAFAHGSRAGFAHHSMPHVDADEHHLAKQGWQELVSSFILRDRAMLNTSPANEELAFATARTWDMASSILATCEVLGIAPLLSATAHSVSSPLVTNLLTGAIGSAATTSFLSFLRNLDLPDPDAFLSGKVKVDVDQLRDDALYVFFSSLVKRMDMHSRNVSNDKKFLQESLRVLYLILRISASRKLDCVFNSVQAMLESNWIQHVIMSAHRHNDTALQNRLNKALSALEATELATYLNVIQGDRCES